MAEHRVPDADAIAEGTLRKLDAGGRALAVARIGGRLFALEDRCPHAGGPLSDGSVEDGTVRCPWHERHFDPATGRCTDHPATRAVRCFPVTPEGIVEIEIEEP